MNLKLTYPQLVLGDKVEINTIDGTKIRMNVPSHSEVCTSLKVQTKGMKVFNEEKTGDLYVNPNGTLPLDAIEVGITRWHINNSAIAFNPVGSSTGQTLWLNEYVLSRVTTPGGDEMLSFNINGTVKKFKIVDCTLESLTLRSTGQWAFGSSGPYESVVIKFTRIGP
jgi:hypothetical protein